MKIKTLDGEIIKIKNLNQLDISEVYWEQTLIGINVVIKNLFHEQLLGTFDSTEEAIAVFKEILLNKNKKIIDILRISKELEIY